MDMPRFFDAAIVTSVADPKDKGRVKIKMIETEIEPDRWIPLVDSVYSKGNNGWDGELAIDDKIIIAYFDYPEKQHPFVHGKIKSKSQTSTRDGKETLKIKEHKVEFSDDEITIEHKDGLGKIIFKSDSIEIQNNSTASFSVIRAELLRSWLESHVHLGNLGYITAPTVSSGFPWVEEIINEDIKIS